MGPDGWGGVGWVGWGGADGAGRAGVGSVVGGGGGGREPAPSTYALSPHAVAAAQLSSYDHSKHVLKHSFGWPEGLTLHVTCSLISGICATIIT